MSAVLSKTNDTIFTTTEAAKYMRLSVDTVRKYVQRGLIAAIGNAGTYHLIAKTECDRYLSERNPVGRPAQVDAE